MSLIETLKNLPSGKSLILYDFYLATLENIKFMDELCKIRRRLEEKLEK